MDTRDNKVDEFREKYVAGKGIGTNQPPQRCLFVNETGTMGVGRGYYAGDNYLPSKNFLLFFRVIYKKKTYSTSAH